MLLGVNQSQPALTRRAALLLVAASIAACALPTVQVVPVAAEPADGQAADKKLPGRIFVTASVRTEDKLETTMISVDPMTGKWARVCDTAGGVLALVSPDKKLVAFGKHADGVWTCAAEEGAAPGRVFDRGFPKAWSPDSKWIIVCDSKLEEGKGWKHEAWRVSASDGTEVTKLPVPETDEVYDWSGDGKWIVTISDRHEPRGSGYQLYLMRPDGKEERRLTKEGGLNAYARFSPDGSKLVYCHQEKGINSVWVVNIDGSDARKVLEAEGVAGIHAACWSADGKQLAVVRFDWEVGKDGQKILRSGEDHNHRFDIVDADGKNRRELKLVDLKPFWMGHPEWR